jgi:hypothetical protein
MNYSKDIFDRINNYKELYNYFENNFDNIIFDKNINKNLIFRVCHIMIQNNLDYAIKILNKLEYDDYTFYSLKINAYSKNYLNLNDAIDILNNIENNNKHFIKKRLYIPIMEAFIKWFPEKSFDFLVKISKMFRLNYEDVYQFFKNDLKNIDIDILFNIISNNNIILNKELFNKELLNIKCNCKLNKINITIPETDALINNFKNEYFKNYLCEKEIKNIDNFCKNKNYNVFIDGANIMFYYKRTINSESYKRLNNIYLHIKKMGYNPLIILHKKHKNEIFKNMNIYYTPYGMNDDCFFLWMGLNTKNSYVVSNDKLTDHIFKISNEEIFYNTLLKWITNSVITFNTYETKDNIQIQLNFPNEISYTAQKCNDIWHIPIGNNEWIHYTF